MKTRTVVLAVVAGVAALVLTSALSAGLALRLADPGDGTQAVTDVAEAPEGPVTSERAQEIALDAYPGVVLDIDRDREGPLLTPVWWVAVRQDDGTVREVYVHRESGDIVTTEVSSY